MMISRSWDWLTQLDKKRKQEGRNHTIKEMRGMKEKGMTQCLPHMKFDMVKYHLINESMWRQDVHCSQEY